MAREQQMMCYSTESESLMTFWFPILIPRKHVSLPCTVLSNDIHEPCPGLARALGALHRQQTMPGDFNENLSTQSIVSGLIESGLHSLYAAFRVSKENSMCQVEAAKQVPLIRSLLGRMGPDMYVPELPVPLMSLLLFLRLQSYSPFPFVYSPDRSPRLIPAGCEVSSCQSDNLVDLLRRVYEIPGGKEWRRVGINAFHLGISQEGKVNNRNASVGIQELPIGVGFNTCARFIVSFAIEGVTNPNCEQFAGSVFAARYTRSTQSTKPCRRRRAEEECTAKESLHT